MKPKPTIEVIQPIDNPVPIEIMAEHIKAISDGVKKLMDGPLNKRAIFLLIQNATPTFKGGAKISITEIRAVLDGIESLESVYLKRTN